MPESAFATPANAPDTSDVSQAYQDAMSALTNLGYQRSEAHRALQLVSDTSDPPRAEALIRQALKELAK